MTRRIRRWSTATLTLILIGSGLLIQAAPAVAAPPPGAAGRLPATLTQLAQPAQPEDDPDAQPTETNEECAARRQVTTINGDSSRGQPETYAWQLCVVMRGSDPQRVQPRLDIDASNGGSFTIDGAIRLCQGPVTARGQEVSLGDLRAECVQRTDIERPEPDQQATVLGSSLPALCTDPEFETDPFVAVLTDFELRGAPSGPVAGNTARGQVSAVLGEITPPISASDCPAGGDNSPARSPDTTTDAHGSRPGDVTGRRAELPGRRAPDCTPRTSCGQRRSILTRGDLRAPIVWQVD